MNVLSWPGPEWTEIVIRRGAARPGPHIVNKISARPGPQKYIVLYCSVHCNLHTSTTHCTLKLCTLYNKTWQWENHAIFRQCHEIIIHYLFLAQPQIANCTLRKVKLSFSRFRSARTKPALLSNFLFFGPARPAYFPIIFGPARGPARPAGHL